jgi:hypothetical protein
VASATGLLTLVIVPTDQLLGLHWPKVRFDANHHSISTPIVPVHPTCLVSGDASYLSV